MYIYVCLVIIILLSLIYLIVAKGIKNKKRIVLISTIAIILIGFMSVIFIKFSNNEEYIKSLIRPRIDWAGTTVVLIGKNTSKSDYVNWEIEHAASKGKRIVGVYLQGESDSEIPEALNKYGNSLQKWNGESIISGITGDNTWNGPGRNWATERVTC